MALFSLEISDASIADPMLAATPRESLQSLGNYFRRLASGGGAPGASAVKVRSGLVRASATATAAAVQVGDTVTVNGTALTAAIRTARGTVTSTVSGIDVDDTVTLGGVVMTAKQQHAKGTLTTVSALATDAFTVGATTFVGAAGAATPGEATFSIDTGDTETATSIAAQINAHAVASTVVTATSASNVVTLRAVASGIAGNSIVLTSEDATITASGSGTLANAVAVAANQFDMSGTDATTAASLSAAMNANATLAALVITTSASAVTYIKALAAGAGGNAITLASSDAQLAVSAATLENGAAVANNTFDFHAQFNTATAVALAAAINASTTDAINDFVTATSSAAVVTVSAVDPGISGNTLTFVSSNGSRLAVTGSGFLASGSDGTVFTYAL